MCGPYIYKLTVRTWNLVISKSYVHVLPLLPHNEVVCWHHFVDKWPRLREFYTGFPRTCVLRSQLNGSSSFSSQLSAWSTHNRECSQNKRQQQQKPLSNPLFSASTHWYRVHLSFIFKIKMMTTCAAIKCRSTAKDTAYLQMSALSEKKWNGFYPKGWLNDFRCVGYNRMVLIFTI